MTRDDRKNTKFIILITYIEKILSIVEMKIPYLMKITKNCKEDKGMARKLRTHTEIHVMQQFFEASGPHSQFIEKTKNLLLDKP